MTIDHDPTPAGFDPPERQSARLSLNEVESLSLKAARGSGVEWGIAEEAGFAAQWLYREGVDSLTPLMDLCHRFLDVSAEAMRPRSLDEFKPLSNRFLCPIALGATISDLGDLPKSPVSMVYRPVLLLPFVARLASELDRSVRVTVENSTALLDNDCLHLEAEFPDMGSPVFSIGTREKLPPKQSSFPTIPSATLKALNTLALKTTVPVSASSRSDAGSDLDDDD